MADEFPRSYGSQQWRMLRRALRNGHSLTEAAELAGISYKEAEGLVELDQENPPPEEAYQLLYDPDAPAAASNNQHKEPDMAESEENAAGYEKPNAELAFKIYDEHIKPKEERLATIKGDMSDPYQRIKQEANFPRSVLNFVNKLYEEEETKRDHMLIALREGLKVRKLSIPRDLVSMANGEDNTDVIPVAERAPDELLADSDDDDSSDPAASAAASSDDGDVDPFDESTDAEIEKQEGRPKRRTARKKASSDESKAKLKVVGTGDDARSAMSKSAQETASMLN